MKNTINEMLWNPLDSKEKGPSASSDPRNIDKGEAWLRRSSPSRADRLGHFGQGEWPSADSQAQGLHSYRRW